MQAALKQVYEMPEKMKDPDYVSSLRSPGSMDRASHPELLAMDLWEQIGTFTKHRLIDEDILLDITSSQVANAWKNAAPAIAVLRQYGGPSVFENFEYLAVRAEQWNRRYPNGAYPAGVPRMSALE